MNADEFVTGLRHLAATAPTESPEARRLLERELTCERHLPERKVLVHPLDDLVWRYGCTELQVGHLRFVSAPRPHWAGHVVGFWEGELLVTEESGRVAIFEHERFGERLLTCAIDGAHFFDALLMFLGMVFERERWLSRIDEAACLCGERAGGAECEEFYLGMLSFLEYGAVDAG